MTPVSGATLEAFRAAAGGTQPTPAGVAVAAAAAAFAFGLLAKSLAVSGRRMQAGAGRASLEALAATAHAQSSRMLQLADDDIAAFEHYLASTRLPQATEPERHVRGQALAGALRRTIDVPLAAARSAASGLQQCAAARPMTHGVVLADLGTVVTLLAGALRAFVLCAQANIGRLPAADAGSREPLARECERHAQAARQGDELLQRIAADLDAAAAARGR
jgi:methenyltetrahydrofolate cyclohydrolase